MSWFDTKSFASLAKTALKEAQKKIDKVLDIQEEEAHSALPQNHQAITGAVSSENIHFGGQITSDLIQTEPRPAVSLSTPQRPEIHNTQHSPNDSSSSSDASQTARSTEATSSIIGVNNLSSEAYCKASSGEQLEIATNKKVDFNIAAESIVVVERCDFDGDSTCGDERVQLVTEVGSNDRSNTEELAYDIQAMDSDSTQSFEELQPLGTTKLEVCDSSNQNRRICGATSNHTSNDEMETATSSDIEIISNPNCDASSTASTTTRASPLKSEQMPLSTAVTGDGNYGNKSIAGASKAHCRQASEISILSLDSPSEDEVEKLLKRISELNVLVEARELRLLQAEQQKSELQERYNELHALLNADNLQSAEEYTQRLSALEKKFMNSIRERDCLRNEVRELHSKLPKNDLTNALKDSQNMVAELRLEGEKLSKEVLQQSNIIKKLRSKEKSTDMQLKTLKDQLASANEEMDRLKRTLSAKEEVERTQIEAVHRMSSENLKIEKDNCLLKGKLEDMQQKLLTMQNNFDSVKLELQQRFKEQSDLSRNAECIQAAERDKSFAQIECAKLQQQVSDLMEKLRSSEYAAANRERQLREENRNLMDRLESSELRAEQSSQDVSQTTIPLMRHLESLQQTLNQRTKNWNKEEKNLLAKLEASQLRLESLEHVEENNKHTIHELQSRCRELEERLQHSEMQQEQKKIQYQVDSKRKEAEFTRQLDDLKQRLSEADERIKSLVVSQNTVQKNISTVDKKHSSSAECLQMNEPSVSFGDLNSADPSTAHRGNSPTMSNGVNSLEDGMGGSVDWQHDDLESVSNPGRGPAMPEMGFHYTIPSTTDFEYLQSCLKQKDGELSQFQWEVSRLQAERNMLQEELSQLAVEMENLKEKLRCYALAEDSFNDLQTRYDALLQMYGEKVEYCEELELDLKECKEAYKTQIQELLGNQNT